MSLSGCWLNVLMIRTVNEVGLIRIHVVLYSFIECKVKILYSRTRTHTCILIDSIKLVWT